MRSLALTAACTLLTALPATVARADCGTTCDAPCFPVRRVAYVHAEGRCEYEPGHYETRIESVRVPGRYVVEERPAVVRLAWDACRRAYVRVVVRPRETVRRWVPGRIEERRVRVYVPGRRICCD